VSVVGDLRILVGFPLGRVEVSASPFDEVPGLVRVSRDLLDLALHLLQERLVRGCPAPRRHDRGVHGTAKSGLRSLCGVVDVVTVGLPDHEDVDVTRHGPLFAGVPCSPRAEDHDLGHASEVRELFGNDLLGAEGDHDELTQGGQRWVAVVAVVAVVAGDEASAADAARPEQSGRFQPIDFALHGRDRGIDLASQFGHGEGARVQQDSGQQIAL